MKKWLLACLFLLPFCAQAEEDMSSEAIAERMKPVGVVDVASAAAPAAAPAAPAAPAAKQVPGEATYKQYCITCHGTGLAGAPKFQTADWKPRLDKQGIDGLVQTAIKGLNAMPPKGTCSTCSDADLKDAIQYMLPKS